MHVPRPCLRCGKEFVPPTTRGRPGGFCSDECRPTNRERCLTRYYRDHEASKKRQRERHWVDRDTKVAWMREYWRQTRLTIPWKHIMAGAKHRAKTGEFEYDLTDAWARARWTGRCEATDIPFMLGLLPTDVRMFAASVDRIDPTKGYTQDNCRFILFAVNCMKQDGTDADVLRIAEAIITKHRL